VINDFSGINYLVKPHAWKKCQKECSIVLLSIFEWLTYMSHNRSIVTWQLLSEEDRLSRSSVCYLIWNSTQCQYSNLLLLPRQHVGLLSLWPSSELGPQLCPLAVKIPFIVTQSNTAITVHSRHFIPFQKPPRQKPVTICAK